MNITELVREAGIYDGREGIMWCSKEQLERFAALVTAEKDKEIAELYEMSVKQAKTIKEYQDAEPVKQEPVAHYKDAPHTIYLQTGCDDPEDCECSFNEWGGTTWCADQIHDTDIPYIRADYAAPVSAKMQGDCTLAEPKCSNLHKAPY